LPGRDWRLRGVPLEAEVFVCFAAAAKAQDECDRPMCTATMPAPGVLHMTRPACASQCMSDALCGIAIAALLGTTSSLARGITFDMSGVTRQAKPAVARPLDGGVRHLYADGPECGREHLGEWGAAAVAGMGRVPLNALLSAAAAHCVQAPARRTYLPYRFGVPAAWTHGVAPPLHLGHSTPAFGLANHPCCSASLAARRDHCSTGSRGDSLDTKTAWQPVASHPMTISACSFATSIGFAMV